MFIVQADQISMGVTSTKFENILATVPTDTIIMKVDIEGYECKVIDYKVQLQALKRH